MSYPESPRDARDDLQRLAEARRQLNEYVRELHAPEVPGPVLEALAARTRRGKTWNK